MLFYDILSMAVSVTQAPSKGMVIILQDILPLIYGVAAVFSLKA